MTTRRTMLELGLAAGAITIAGAAAGNAQSGMNAKDGRARDAINGVLDDWHAAAAAADEARYFGHMTSTSLFMGTDATERWTKEEFQAYAHPFFAKGKAWSFTSVRRSIGLGPGLTTAWFEEDLETPNLGPSRGSGVMLLEGKVWRIEQYDLSVPIPNGVFDEVKKLIAAHLAKPKV
jgi:hypothetical protein